MIRLLEPLWLVLASAGDSKLTQVVEYLKEENKILRSKLPKRIPLTKREKNRLVKFGEKLGSAIHSIITIVSPRTFLRWVKGESKSVKDKKPGRPKIEGAVEELIVKLAKENDGWGYTRIVGELKKLYQKTVCRSTVKNVLISHGYDPQPKRNKGSWSDFLTRHADTLWASDFLQVKTMTSKGMVDLFVLFFIHPCSRKVILGGITANPNSKWMQQMARNVSNEMTDLELPIKQLIIDHDSKYTKEFDAVFGKDCEVKRVGPFAPNLNAFAERFAQTLRHECLDHFLIFGEKHLRYLLNEFLENYHDERPHQSLNNKPPNHQAEENILSFAKDQTTKIECKERLGGFLKSYSRVAA